MTKRQLLQEKRTEILKVASKHGARNLRLFGSIARGEERLESDIDLLVEMEAGRSLLSHAALVLELEKLLGTHVDIATERGLRPRIREQALKEAIPL